jgi:hypothetical protein
MFDDPRWGDDPRERDDSSRDLSRGSRGGSDPRERERTDPRDVFMDQSISRVVSRENTSIILTTTTPFAAPKRAR